MIVRSQLEDYQYRGSDLETKPFIRFIIDTYEELIPAKERQRTPAPEPSSQEHQPKLGRPRHQRIRYTEDHPRAKTHWRVMRRKNHNTLPNISGPWFPKFQDQDQHDLYCACMLAITKPWCHLSDLKDDSLSWSTTLEHLLRSAPGYVQDIIAGTQYYYESKSASEAAHEEHSFVHVNQTDDVTHMDVDEAEASSTQPLVLTEANVIRYEAEQASGREQAHGLTAVVIGIANEVFVKKERVGPCHTNGVSIATGRDLTALESWLQSMSANVLDLNGSGRDPSIADGEVSMLNLMPQEADGLGDVVPISLPTALHEALEPVSRAGLLEDQ